MGFQRKLDYLVQQALAPVRPLVDEVDPALTRLPQGEHGLPAHPHMASFDRHGAQQIVPPNRFVDENVY